MRAARATRTRICPITAISTPPAGPSVGNVQRGEKAKGEALSSTISNNKVTLYSTKKAGAMSRQKSYKGSRTTSMLLSCLSNGRGERIGSGGGSCIDESNRAEYALTDRHFSFSAIEFILRPESRQINGKQPEAAMAASGCLVFGVPNLFEPKCRESTSNMV